MKTIDIYKKILATILAGTTTLTVAGCSKSNDIDNNKSENIGNITTDDREEIDQYLNYYKMPKSESEIEEIMQENKPTISYSYDCEKLEKVIDYTVYSGFNQAKDGTYTSDNTIYGDLKDISNFDYYQAYSYSNNEFLDSYSENNTDSMQLKVNGNTIIIPLKYAQYSNKLTDIIIPNSANQKNIENNQIYFSLEKIEENVEEEENIINSWNKTTHIADFNSLDEINSNEYEDGQYEINVYQNMYRGIDFVDGKYVFKTCLVSDLNDLEKCAYYIVVPVLKETYFLQYPEQKIMNY